MMSNNRNGDQQFNGPFDQWLREHRPPQPAFSQDMDAFLEEFQLRMAAEQKARSKRRRRNLKRGSTVMIVALLSLAVFNLPELGGDGFNMVEVEDAQTPGGVVKNEFRGEGFNPLEGQSIEDIAEINQVIAAGEGKTILIEGWEVGGETHWGIVKEILVNGELSKLVFPPKQMPSKYTPKHARFYLGPWGEYLKAIDDGTLRPSGTKDKTVDSIHYSIKTWEIHDSDFGTIIYSRGIPIH